jgi:uncharacterized protein (DUF1810 family)
MSVVDTPVLRAVNSDALFRIRETGVVVGRNGDGSVHDLERFIAAQERDFDRALAELIAGHKDTHWIWYVFPQLKSLGYSDRAIYFGIEDIDEARAYLDDPTLGPRYLRCVTALLSHRERKIEEIVGRVDADKLRSSLTLMQRAGGGLIVDEALEAFYGGHPCTRTLAELGS